MLLFATNNAHKLEEARAILPCPVMSLAEVGIHEDIPETGVTLEANSLEKARFVFNRLHQACFADDTGLEVDCLHGAPGYMTARYSGEPVDSNRNMDKLLEEMAQADPSLTNRGAQFRTVITYIRDDGETFQVSGIVRGRIALRKSGTAGFGYDPLFIPDPLPAITSFGSTTASAIPNDLTFSELGEEVKNHISHRARALHALLPFL